MSNIELSNRLLALRKQHGYSLADVAEGTGLSKSFLRFVELGQTDISISRLMKVAAFYDTSVGELVDPGGSPDTTVVRAGKARHVQSPAEGIHMTLLAPDSERRMMPMLMDLDPGAAAIDAASHEGEESATVIEGSVDLDLNGQRLRLGVRDSVYFDATVPHIYRNRSNQRAVVFLVVTPPSL